MRQSHGSILPMLPGPRRNRFQFVWTKAPPGDYALTAVATDNAGLETTSAAVNITVTTNLPTPEVRIINPSSGAEFPDFAVINIFAAAGETNGVVDTVEFFADTNSLGTVTNYLATEPVGQFPSRAQWLPYFFAWTNAPVGSNILRAVATDNNGSKATSAPVSITVTTNVFHRRHW
jgi:chitinase